MSRFLPRRRSSAATIEPGRHRAVPEPTSGRGRRATAMVAAVLAMSGTLVGITAVTTTVTASAAPAPFGCDSFGYLFQGASIKQVDLVGNTNVVVKGDDPDAPNLNGVGYNPRDNLFYGKYTDNGAVGLASVDANYTVTKLPGTVTGLRSNFNVGDFDPQGHLWISDTVTWLEVDLTPGSPTFGTTLRQGTLDNPDGLDTGADWGYINGAFYRVMATTAAVGGVPQGTGHVVRFVPPAAGASGPAANGTVTDLGPLREGPLGTPGYLNTANNGAVYPQGGYLWSSENQSGEIRRIDVRTLAVAGPYPGPSSGSNDGARCATAPIPTLTVTKQVAGRAAQNDQFTVSVTRSGSSTVEASATTTGTQTTATTPNTPVSEDATYTVTDAMAAGSTSTLANYTPTISCQDGDGNRLATTGAAPSWRVTIPGTDDYACTVTNTLIQNDLRITKTGPATTTANGSVTWNLGVTNLSGVTSPRDTVVDTLPIGFTNVTAPTGCTVTGSDAAGYVVTCQQGPLAVGAPAQTIAISARAPATYSTPYVNTARVSGPITDLAQDNNTANSTTRVSDGALTLSKTVSSAGSASAQTANAVPGQVVTYTITATDAGGGTWSAADPATFSDDLTDVLKDATFVPGSATASVGTVTPPAAGGTSLGWSGVPNGSTPVTVTYQVRVGDPDLAGDWTMVNTVSSPYAQCTPALCQTTTTIAQLRVAKAVTTTPAAPGSTLTYSVTVSNPGSGAWSGADAANTATVADDLSDVVKNATYNNDATIAANNAGATNAQLNRTASGLTWAGPLPAGGTFTITYSVKINDPFNGTDYDLTNTATAPHSNCTTPGTAGCTTTTPVADLIATKTSPTVAPLPGSKVSYSITLRNPGSAAWTDATRPTATDDLADVLDDATWNNDAVAIVSGGGAAAGAFGPTPSTTVPLTWTGSVPAGQTVTITYSVTVDSPFRAGANRTLVNGVRTPVGPCGPNGTATACPATTQKLPDLTTSKIVSSGVANPGQQVTYTILLANPGSAAWPAGTRLFTDDLSDLLDDATLVAGPTATNPSDPTPARLEGNTLVYDAALDAQPASITYTVRVNSPGTGNHNLANTVVPIVPCTSGCTTTTVVPDLSVRKKADTADASEGTRVGYTITATNTGGTAWTTANPAVVTDDMSAALDDASFDGNVAVKVDDIPVDSSGVVRTATGFTWTGPLATGSTVTLTYSVVVNTPDTGDRIMPNAIVTPNGGSCSTGSTDPNCTTTTRNATLEVTKTPTTTKASEGSVVGYTITGKNNGRGNWTADRPAVITDDLSGVLDDATFDGNVVVKIDGVTVPPTGVTRTATGLRWAGPLAAGSTVTLDYSVVVNTPDTGNRILRNTVTAPGGECRAGCSTETTVALLTVTKTRDLANAAPGSVVTYTITATASEGDFTATNPASLKDDLTDVLDDATFNGDAKTEGDSTVAPDTSALPTLSWTGALLNGQSIKITYSVTVKAPDTGNRKLINTVTGPSGNCRAGCSTSTDVPDLVISKTVSPGAVYPGAVIEYTITASNNTDGAWTATRPARLTDDLSGLLDDATFNNDVTIQSSSVQPVYTAPLLSWEGPLAAQSSITITYSVTIKSPDTGDHDVVNTVTGPPGTNCAAGSTDPACSTTSDVADLTVTKSTATGPTGPGQKVTYTLSVLSSGTGDWTTTTPAVVTDDLTDVLDDATYNNDAVTQGDSTSPADASALPKLTWTGPLESGQAITITYSVTVNDPDTGNHRLINKVSALGNCVDPAAPGCSTTTLAADLQVTKTADRQDAVPGSALKYSLVVRNNGEGDWTAANPAIVRDDLTRVLDDATYNNDATTDTGAGAFDFTAPTLRWTGSLAAKSSLTITYSVTVNTPVTGDHRLINSVGSVGSCRAGTTDPACSTESLVPDLTVSKVSSSGVAQPGATLTYTITATNSGEGDWTAAFPATLSDTLSGLLDDATYNDDVSITGASSVKPTYSAPTISWKGPLAAKASVTITYSVTVNEPDRGDHTLPNAVVGPVGTGCAAGSTDPDCATTTGIADLAITKTTSTRDVAPGQQVSYTVTATSVGTAPWTSTYAPVTDDLSKLLDDATYNADAAAVLTSVTGATTVAQPTYTEPTISWSGDLAVGDSVTITYSVTVDDPDTGDHELPNTIAGAGNCADPTDPTCTTNTKIADLTVTKTADKVNAVPGGKVTYTVTATNDGKGDWTDTNPASLTDDLSKVLDDATWNSDVAITGSTVAPAYAEPTLTWSGALAAGDTVVITYSVTVKSPVTGDHKLGNTVVSAIGDCEAGTTNSACSAEPKIPDLTVAKTASSSVAEPGKTITYKIVVTNTGAGDWTPTEPAVVRDDLSKVLDDAAWNGDAAVTGNVGTLKYTEATLNWTGPLAAGAAVTITYSVTVDTLGTGDHRLLNTVSAAAGNCIDPAATGCATDTPAASYTVTKTSDPESGASVKPGQTVHYRLTIKNTGQVDLNPVVTDDMTQALDDATWVGDAKARTGSMRFAKPTLTWTGPLPIGATTVVTYSLKVDTDGRGDGKLLNVVVGNGPETNCGDSTQCTTNSAISSETIARTGTGTGTGTPAYTGVDSRTLLTLAGLMLLLGLLALFFGRGGSTGGTRRKGPRGPQGPRGPSGSGGGRGRRLVTALIAAAVGLTACTSGSSAPAPSSATPPVNSSAPVASTGGGAATVSIDGVRADLQVTSCTATASRVAVVAQSGAAWTAQLRQDTATRSTFLVLVHQTGKSVRTYQASATAAHPRGLGQTRIEATRKGKTFSARATLATSSALADVKSTVSKPGRTRTGTFDATCTRPGG